MTGVIDNKVLNLFALCLLAAIGGSLAIAPPFLQVGIVALTFGLLLVTISLKQDIKFLPEFAFLLPIYFGLIGWPVKVFAGDLVVLWLIPLIPLPFVTVKILRNPGILSPVLSAAKVWGPFVIFAVMSLLWSCNVTHGTIKLIILLTYGLIPGLYLKVLSPGAKRLSWNAVLCVGLVYSAAIILFGTSSEEFPGRLALPGANPIWCARATLFSAMAAVWFRDSSKLLRIATFVVSLYGCFLTQSRGPLVAFAVANLIALAVHLKRKKATRISTKLVMTISAVVIISSMAFALLPDLMQRPEFGRLSSLTTAQGIKDDDNISSRIHAQKEALSIFSDHPVLGAGIGSFATLGSLDYPHFLPLEILCELGLLGLGIWICTILKLLRRAKADPMLLAIFLQAIFFALTSGDLGFDFEYVLVSFLILTVQESQPSLRLNTGALTHAQG